MLSELDTYQNDLRAYIGSRVPEYEIDDILQEVRIALWHNEFREASSFKTYLYSITNKKIVDYYRHKPNYVLREKIQSYNPYIEIDKKIDLERYLDKQNLLTQQILKLYFMGYKKIEISRILDINYEMLKSRIRSLKCIE